MINVRVRLSPDRIFFLEIVEREHDVVTAVSPAFGISRPEFCVYGPS